MNDLEDAFRAAGGTIEQLVRAIVRDELRRHLGPESYAFCIWDGGFLPSEAEWEYAAAGGSQQREYPWGSTDPGTANQYAIYGCYYLRVKECRCLGSRSAKRVARRIAEDERGERPRRDVEVERTPPTALLGTSGNQRVEPPI
jgi:hypothetical protein